MEKGSVKSRFGEEDLEREDQEQGFGHNEFDLLTGHSCRDSHQEIIYETGDLGWQYQFGNHQHINAIQKW